MASYTSDKPFGGPLFLQAVPERHGLTTLSHHLGSIKLVNLSADSQNTLREEILVRRNFGK